MKTGEINDLGFLPSRHLPSPASAPPFLQIPGSSLMGALTDNRKRRALDQRLLSSLYPDSPPPPSKKSKLVELPSSDSVAMETQRLQQQMHQSGFSSPPSHPVEIAAGDHPSSRPRFPPPALRRPIHAPQRILTAFGLGSGSGSDKRRFDGAIPSHKKDTSTEGPSEKIESRGLKRDASFLSTQTGRNVEVVDLSGAHGDIDTRAQIGDLGLGLSRSCAHTAAAIIEENGEVVSEKCLESKKRFSKSWKKVSNLKSGYSNIPKKCLQSELGLSKVSNNFLDSEFEFSATPGKVSGSELVSSLTTVTNSPEIERSGPSLEQYKKLVSSVSNFTEARVLSKKMPLYKELYNQSARSHNSKLKELDSEVKLAEMSIAKIKLLGDILDSKHKVILSSQLNLFSFVRRFQLATKENMVHKTM
jgi:hypothetical protein